MNAYTYVRARTGEKLPFPVPSLPLAAFRLIGGAAFVRWSSRHASYARNEEGGGERALCLWRGEEGGTHKCLLPQNAAEVGGAATWNGVLPVRRSELLSLL